MENVLGSIIMNMKDERRHKTKPDIIFVDLPLMLSTNAWNLGYRYMLSSLRSRGYTGSLLYASPITIDSNQSKKSVDSLVDELEKILAQNVKGVCQPRLMESYLLSSCFNGMISRIKERQPRLIGFSVFASTLPLILKFINKLRKCGIASPIVLGGHYVTAVDDVILKNHPEIDFIIRGEGELAICELIECLNGKREYSSVRGLTYRNGNEVHINDPRPFVEDLNTLPFPATDNYQFLVDADKRDMIPLSSSRGCYYKCTYCSIQKFYRQSPKSKLWRAASPEYIVSLMTQQKKRFGASSFNFIDDLFLVPSKAGKTRAAEIAKRILRRRIKTRFAITTRADSLDARTLKLLKRAGLNQVFLGIESNFQRGLDTYRKDITVKENHEALALLRRAGLYYNLNLIFFDPYMKPEEMKENLSLIKQLRDDKYTLFFSPFVPLNIYPGTELAEILERDNLLKGDYLDYDFSFVDSRTDQIHSLLKDLPTGVLGFAFDLIVRRNLNLVRLGKNISKRSRPLLKNHERFIFQYRHWFNYIYRARIIELAIDLYQGNDTDQLREALLQRMVSYERTQIIRLFHRTLKSLLKVTDPSSLYFFTSRRRSLAYCGHSMAVVTLPKTKRRNGVSRNEMLKIVQAGFFYSPGDEILIKSRIIQKKRALSFVVQETNENPGITTQSIANFFSARFDINKRTKFIPRCHDPRSTSEQCYGTPDVPQKEPMSPDNFDGLRKRVMACNKKLYYCPAGISSYYINQEGDIYPCRRFSDVNQMKMGNVQNNTWDEIVEASFIDASVDKKPNCDECWAKYLCGGGCAFECFHKKQDIYRTEEMPCDHIKSMIGTKMNRFMK